MPDPMGGLIRVPTIFADTGPQLATIASQITEELGTLKNYLTPYVTGVDWQGVANTSYSDLQLRWDSAAADLMTSEGTLGALSHTATVNWQNHVDAEQANIKTWQH
jgi:uncharacterized protein YukE